MARAKGHTSSSPYWPGAVNHGQLEPRSAEPADGAGKQTGLARQGLFLHKQRPQFGKYWVIESWELPSYLLFLPPSCFSIHKVLISVHPTSVSTAMRLLSCSLGSLCSVTLVLLPEVLIQHKGHKWDCSRGRTERGLKRLIYLLPMGWI